MCINHLLSDRNKLPSRGLKWSQMTIEEYEQEFALKEHEYLDNPDLVAEFNIVDDIPYIELYCINNYNVDLLLHLLRSKRRTTLMNTYANNYRTVITRQLAMMFINSYYTEQEVSDILQGVYESDLQLEWFWESIRTYSLYKNRENEKNMMILDIVAQHYYGFCHNRTYTYTHLHLLDTNTAQLDDYRLERFSEWKDPLTDDELIEKFKFTKEQVSKKKIK